MTHSPDAKTVRAEPILSRDDWNSFIRAQSERRAPQPDERTSFPALTDEEAEEERERLRLDRATIYAT